jgi:methylated-DNA-[protein]-cysteine S-methyltransferase
LQDKTPREVLQVLEVWFMRKDEVRTEEDVVQFLSDKSEFERAVYVATFRIPRGKVCTYRRIAEMVGKPKAYRAVANTLHKNPLYPIVPCHRVVRSDGAFGGEKRGAERRRKRVEEEGVPIIDGKVRMTEKVLF